MQPQVTVVIVTLNSLPYIRENLESLRKQTYPAWELVIIDNASSDGTVAYLNSVPFGRKFYNQSNVGFAAAQNQGIAMSTSEWVLALNPDVVLEPEFIATLLDAVATLPNVGTVCGKLLRWEPEERELFSRTIDSTGMYFRPDLRHLDRGADEIDTGQYDEREYVFGATGAAALYRREMMKDISVNGQFFDEEFFSYREDADVAWRAQMMGWSCVYIAEARGWHVRLVTPERRNELPAAINWHSVKNRFLMRIKNAGARLWLNLLIPSFARDVMILGYAVVVDRRLLSALLYPLKNWRPVWQKRRTIQSRRRVQDSTLLRWFRFRPQSVPLQQPRAGWAERKAG